MVQPFFYAYYEDNAIVNNDNNIKSIRNDFKKLVKIYNKSIEKYKPNFKYARSI